jgi:small subunit ribosomal protein S16
VISIHLRRTGAKKDPHYRVVVTDSRAARDGAFIEVLGHYHPRFEPARVVLDVAKTKAWIEKGAQPSDTVKSLLRKVESGSVDVEQPVAPSRHRDAARHAEIRASAPTPEPEAAEAAADEAPAEEKAAAEQESAPAQDEAAVEEAPAEEETAADEAEEGKE